MNMDVFKLMNKPFNSRTESDIKAISEFLIKLDTFKEILSTLEEKFQSDRLISIATYIKCNHLDRNRIVYKYGDRIGNYNLVLKGKVTILIPKKEKQFLTEEDYLYYLLKLRKYNEYELLEQCIAENMNEFEIPSNFDVWLNQQLQPHSFPKSENSKNNLRYLKTGFLNNITIIDAIKETLRCATEKNHEIECTSESYINRINPVMSDMKSTNEKKLVTVYRYIIAETLENGGKIKEFGERNVIFNISIGSNSNNGSNPNRSFYMNANGIANPNGNNNANSNNAAHPNNKSNRSPFTIITEDDCYFGWIQNSKYNKIIKEFNEKNKKALFYSIISYDMFKNISLFNLERKYLQYFKSENFKRGEYVLNQNDLIAHLYFLKCGEFELSVSLSVIEVIQLIQILSKFSDSAQSEKFSFIKDEISNESHLFKNEEEFKKIFLKKKRIKMGIIKDKEIIGLQDLVYMSNLLDFHHENNHSIFTVKCVSDRSEIFKISIEEFKNILERENSMKEDVGRYMKNKRKFIASKLEFYLIEQYEIYKHKENQGNLKEGPENYNMVDDKINLRRDMRGKEEKSSNREKIVSSPVHENKQNFQKKSLPYNLNLNKNAIKINKSDKEDLNPSSQGPKLSSTILPRLNSVNNENKEMQDLRFGDLDVGGESSKSCNFLNNYKNKIIRRCLFDNVMNNYLDHKMNKNLIYHNSSQTIPFNQEQSSKVIDFLIMDKFKYIYSFVVNSASNKVFTTDQRNKLIPKNFNIPILAKKFDKIRLNFANTKIKIVNPEKE